MQLHSYRWARLIALAKYGCAPCNLCLSAFKTNLKVGAAICNGRQTAPEQSVPSMASRSMASGVRHISAGAWGQNGNASQVPDVVLSLPFGHIAPSVHA